MERGPPSGPLEYVPTRSVLMSPGPGKEHCDMQVTCTHDIQLWFPVESEELTDAKKMNEMLQY